MYKLIANPGRGQIAIFLINLQSICAALLLTTGSVVVLCCLCALAHCYVPCVVLQATQVLFVSTQNFVSVARVLGGCGSRNLTIPSKYLRYCEMCAQ